MPTIEADSSDWIPVRTTARKLGVDVRTLKARVSNLLYYFGPKDCRIRRTDHERILEDGIPYYQDKITQHGIR